MDILRALRAENIEVVVATGRRYRFAKAVFENCGFPVTILCSGGTCARNIGDDGRIMSRHLDAGLVHDIVSTGREQSLHPVLHVDKYEEGCDFLIEYEMDSPCYNAYITGGVKEYRVVGDLLKNAADGILLMCYMAGERELESFREKLLERHGRRLHCHILTTLTRIGPVLEIMNPLGTKWRALAEYARGLAISPGEIVALGDDNNDIEMVAQAGLGIAMRNATRGVKGAARAVTLHTNNQDGAARSLAGVFGLGV
jgi:hydroxymethylpyrimidine pyrophosphatase-like HAD family hydrolase